MVLIIEPLDLVVLCPVVSVKHDHHHQKKNNLMMTKEHRKLQLIKLAQRRTHECCTGVEIILLNQSEL